MDVAYAGYTQVECTSRLLRKAYDAGMDYFFAVNNTEDRSASLADRIAPSIESWLDSFHSADCGFTDSFHGCVFSIIFRKPFYAYVIKVVEQTAFIHW